MLARVGPSRSPAPHGRGGRIGPSHRAKGLHVDNHADIPASHGTEELQGDGGTVLQVADLVLDTATRRARRGHHELQLTPIGSRLLAILMRASPRVVSRREIEQRIWGDRLPESDTLRSHVYTLRRTIDRPFRRPLLHTIHAEGYRLAELEGEGAHA